MTIDHDEGVSRMRVFHCGKCDQLVFFENTNCVACGGALAFVPELEDLVTLEPAGGDRWRSLGPSGEGREYWLCVNYTQQNVCNWAVPAESPECYCLGCRLTRVVPDVSQSGVREGWAKLEAAKRRLLYSLLNLDLPLETKVEDPARGLAFEFLADPTEPGKPPVLTGHADGVITINVAEADDAEREKRRQSLGENYRTLVGHFRHEVGHYFWDRLVRDDFSRLDGFRALFGDDRQDYGEALARHHQYGAPGDWPARFVSAYASAHPWEDWAETWAHYLHITDTLETAVECGLSLRPRRAGEPTLKPDIAVAGKTVAFDDLIKRWFPITYVLNSLNRGMGMPDAYPFVLSQPAVDKLRFVHETILAAAPPDAEPAAPDLPAPIRHARGLFHRMGVLRLLGL